MYAVCKLFSQLIFILDYNLCIAAICFPVIWDKAKCEVRVFQKWIEVKMNSFDSKCCINCIVSVVSIDVTYSLTHMHSMSIYVDQRMN